MSNINLVFSYGTLIDMFPGERIEATLISNFRLGKFNQYPALIIDDKTTEIQGFLLKLTKKEFRKSDHYEGYPSLYDRIQKEVIVDGEKILAWVYYLNKQYETTKSKSPLPSW